MHLDALGRILFCKQTPTGLPEKFGWPAFTVPRVSTLGDGHDSGSFISFYAMAWVLGCVLTFGPRIASTITPALFYFLHPCSHVGIRLNYRRGFMPGFRRYWVPSDTYYFMVNLFERRLDALIRHIDVHCTKQPA